MWNAISPGFELVSPCPIPTTITITPRAPPYDDDDDDEITHKNKYAIKTWLNQPTKYQWSTVEFYL